MDAAPSALELRLSFCNVFLHVLSTPPQKWYTIYKDHITLADYEIHDGMGLELYYN